MIKFFDQNCDKRLLNRIFNKFQNDNWVNSNITNTLEKNIQKYLKIQNKVSTCNSGSDALMLALLLDKKKNKDIYLTTPISYIASASIAKFINLELIYIDVEPKNYLMSLDKLEVFLRVCPKKIKKRIKGIINVELFGATCDLDRLNKISKKYKLSLIGDCAQSFGTLYKKKSTVSFYDYSITSFYPTKVLSCYGDGGALFLKKNYKKSILLKNNGHTKDNKSICKILGINSRLDGIQSYILTEKLKKIKNILTKRKLHTKILTRNLNKYFKIPVINNNVVSNDYIFSFYIDSKDKKKFIAFMIKNKIECKIFYPKLLNENKPLKPIFKTNLKNAQNCSKSLVSIPNHERLKAHQIKKIITTINSFI